jgi:hypothetical protein
MLNLKKRVKLKKKAEFKEWGVSKELLVEECACTQARKKD